MYGETGHGGCGVCGETVALATLPGWLSQAARMAAAAARRTPGVARGSLRRETTQAAAPARCIASLQLALAAARLANTWAEGSAGGAAVEGAGGEGQGGAEGS